MQKKQHLLITRFPFESVLSGEEWHTITLCEALRDKGVDVSFMGSCPVLLQELGKRNFPVYSSWGGTLPVSKWAVLLFLFTWPAIFYSLWKKIQQIHHAKHVETIYMLSLTEKLLLTPFLQKRGLHVIWVEHQRFGRWFYKNPLLFLYKKWALNTPIITVSADHKHQLLVAGIPDKQIHIITNGIDTTFFTPNGDRPFQDQSLFTIGIVARLSYDKGVDLALRAIAHLKDAYPQLRLIIQGEGPMKQELIQLAEKLHLQEHVRFFEPYREVPREYMPAFYRSLSCFILPSRLHDPFGLVVAEALSCGVPTIVTTACGISQQLHDGQHALIVDADDRNALQKAIRTLIQDSALCTHLQAEGIAIARTTFSLTSMVDSYIVQLFPTSSSPSL